MSQEFTIAWVGSSREWESKRGDHYLAYEVKVEGDDRVIEWSRKPDSDPPEVGKTTPLADIENGSHGPKLKVDWSAVKQQGGSTSSSGSKTYEAKSWQPEAQRDPERAARILRQHSQEMAIRYCALLGDRVALDQIFAYANQFDADVIKAAQAGGVTSQAPPAAQETQSNAEYLSKLLEEAGFDLAQVTVVQRYIETNFDNERRTKVEAALKDITRAPKAYDQLKQETEAWTKEPLPVNDPASDDIPF